MGLWLGLWCLTPLSTLFQLYRSVLLVEETGGPGENDRPTRSKKQILFLIEISVIFLPVLINYRVRLYIFLMFHVNLLFSLKYVDRNSTKRHSP